MKTYNSMGKNDHRTLQCLVFLQDSEGVDECENILDNGEISIVDHMKQWDMGEYGIDSPMEAWEVSEQCGDGTYYEQDNYIVFRQRGGLNYSLYRIFTEQEAKAFWDRYGNE